MDKCEAMVLTIVAVLVDNFYPAFPESYLGIRLKLARPIGCMVGSAAPTTGSGGGLDGCLD